MLAAHAVETVFDAYEPNYLCCLQHESQPGLEAYID